MSRPIKFRQPLWDKRNKFKKWHYWGFVRAGFESPIWSPDSSLEEARKESQQFTGLKDKNGKEIYEDSKVKVWGEGALDNDFTIHKIVWCGDRGYPAFDLEPPIDTDCNGISYAIAVGRIELIEEKNNG